MSIQGQFLCAQWNCYWGTPEVKFPFNIFLKPHCTAVLLLVSFSIAKHVGWASSIIYGQRIMARNQAAATDSFKVVVTYCNLSWETSVYCNLLSTSGIASRKVSIAEARRAMVIGSEPAANLRRLNYWMTQRVHSTFFLTFLLKSSSASSHPHCQEIKACCWDNKN